MYSNTELAELSLPVLIHADIPRHTHIKPFINTTRRVRLSRIVSREVQTDIHNAMRATSATQFLYEMEVSQND